MLGSSGGAVVISAIIGHFTTRYSSKVAASAKQREGDATVQVAAITSFTQLVAMYQQDIGEMRLEIEGMRTRFATREKELNDRMTKLANSNHALIRLYDKAFDYIEFQRAILVKTNPDLPPHTFPKDINEIL